MKTDLHIVEGFKKLYAGAIADVLNAMGYRSVIDPAIRPIYPGIKICGRALTIKVASASKGVQCVANEAKEASEPGDIVVIDIGGDVQSTVWGDNSSTACRIRGAVGAVIDGACRDIAELREMKFPVFCRAISPGIRGNTLHPISYNVAVNCGGVQVDPGDIVYGDDDGVIVVPKEIAGEVLAKTRRYAELDKAVKEALLAGKPVSEAYKAKDSWVKKILA